ncbi:hypothetical protein [Chitinophaga vietnamensis]|uniref:hypothetical protein n=1 Tax=Chitinophaga vietnamensis TaxID=2593957 RepID=UPI00117859D9|nr:hypothetical protein [Chitinophaga vietnamensis]
MKKNKFSLESFSDVKAFSAEELKLINGGTASIDEMCSDSNDSDSGRNCSVTSDTDTADAATSTLAA